MMFPPRFTALLWSNVGTTAPFFAFVDRTHQMRPVLRFTPPIKTAGSVGVQNGIAAEDVVLQYAGSYPPRAAVCSVCKTCFPEIRRNAVELAPANAHPVWIITIDTNGRLICSVANSVVAIRVH